MPTRAGVPRWGRRVPVSRCDRESRIPGSSRIIPADPGLKLLIDLTVRAPARLLEPEKVDFSMDTSVVASEVNSWLKVVFSKTLRAFHGMVLLSIVIVMFAIGNR